MWQSEPEMEGRIIYYIINHRRESFTEAVHLMQLKYLLFTRMPGGCYRRLLRALLLGLRHVFRAIKTALFVDCCFVGYT